MPRFDRQPLRLPFFTLLVAIVLVAVACGGDAEENRSRTEPETRARDAVFLEEDTSGRLVWRLHIGAIEQTVDGVDGETLTLNVHGYKSAASADSQVSTANARTGQVRQEGDTTLIRLSGGFTMHSADGWNAEGEAIEWNGRVMKSGDPVTISRGRTWLMGEKAVIDPNRNSFRVYQVQGVVEDLSL